MTSKLIGIEEARGKLGDIVTAAQQGTDIVLTRNGKPVARLTGDLGHLVTFQGFADGRVEVTCSCGLNAIRPTPAAAERAADCHTGKIEPSIDDDDFDLTVGRVPEPGVFHGSMNPRD